MANFRLAEYQNHPTLEILAYNPTKGFYIRKVVNYKEGCVFPMVIWSEFRVRQYRDDGHREDEPHFILRKYKSSFLI